MPWHRGYLRRMQRTAVPTGLRPRVAPAVAAVLTVAAGLSVRSVLGGDLAKYAGDALYALLIFWLVLVVAPRTRGWVAALVAFGVSVAVELFQLTGVPAELVALFAAYGAEASAAMVTAAKLDPAGWAAVRAVAAADLLSLLPPEPVTAQPPLPSPPPPYGSAMAMPGAVANPSPRQQSNPSSASAPAPAPARWG